MGQAEGLSAPLLKNRIAAAQKLVPYIKLVERERLRPPVKSEQAYREFFGSEETDRLFAQLIADKLTLSQILVLLAEQPLSTGEIAERLALEPAAVSRHMNSSSRQGLVQYDLDHHHYALTQMATGAAG